MTSSLTKRFEMSLTLSNKENRKIGGGTPCMVEYMETNFDLTKPRHNELILPVPRVSFSLFRFRPASSFCLDFSYLKQRKSETSFSPLSSEKIR